MGEMYSNSIRAPVGCFAFPSQVVGFHLMKGSILPIVYFEKTKSESAFCKFLI